MRCRSTASTAAPVLITDPVAVVLAALVEALYHGWVSVQEVIALVVDAPGRHQGRSSSEVCVRLAETPGRMVVGVGVGGAFAWMPLGSLTCFITRSMPRRAGAHPGRYQNQACQEGSELAIRSGRSRRCGKARHAGAYAVGKAWARPVLGAIARRAASEELRGCDDSNDASAALTERPLND